MRCSLPVGVAGGAHLCRPGLPGQTAQRLCVGDVVGLVYQRPALHLGLHGGRENSGWPRHPEQVGRGVLGCLTCSSMFHTTTEPSQLAEA